MFSCEFCEVYKNTFFTEHLWATASVIMRRSDLSLQSSFVIKVYQPKENPTVGQISEKKKHVQCFLCFAVCILNSEKIILFIFYKKNISNTQVKTELTALT